MWKVIKSRRHARVVILVLAAVLLVSSISGYLARSYSKIESSYVALMFLERAWVEEDHSGRSYAAVDLVFRSNLHQLGTYRQRPEGGLVFYLVRELDPKRKKLIITLDQKYGEHYGVE